MIRPHVFSSIDTETSNTNINHVIHKSNNFIDNIIFAKVQIWKTNQFTITNLKFKEIVIHT